MVASCGGDGQTIVVLILHGSKARLSLKKGDNGAVDEGGSAEPPVAGNNKKQVGERVTIDLTSCREREL